MEKITCEIAVVMDEGGNWRVARWDCADAAVSELLAEEVGYATRTVKVKVRMRKPVIDEITIDVPDDAGETVVAEGVL